MATLKAIFTAQDNLSKAMAKAGNAGSKTTGIMQKLGKIGSVAMKGIIAAVTAAGTALVALGKKVVNVGMEFETSMSQVMATMGIDKSSTFVNSAGEVVNSYELLSATAEKMGAETAFTSSQAADALNYLALAGYDAEKAAEALPTVLHLAGAGGMEIAAASDLITDAMAALQTDDTMETFADKMAKTASTTNTSVSQLGEAILTVGATAANLRNGTTELNTQLGILANVGIKGAEGGTHLRNILLRLQNPTAKAAKQLEKLGVSVYDTDGKMRDTGAIFSDLKTAMAGMNQNEIDQVMATIFNKTDIAAANALLAASGDEYDRIFSIIENSGGAAAEMYQTMLDNLKGDTDIFKSAQEALYLALYKSVNGTLRELVQTGTSYMNRLLDAFNEGGFEGLVSELGNVLGDAIGVIMGYMPNLIEAGTSIIMSLVDSIGNNADTITDALANIAFNLSKAIIKIGPKLIRAFGKIIKGAGQAIFRIIPKIFNAIPDRFYKALGLDPHKTKIAVGKFAANMITAIRHFFDGNIIGGLGYIGKAFGLDDSTIGKIKTAFTNVGTWFKNSFSDIKSAFSRGYEKGGLLGGLKESFGTAGDILKKLTLGDDYTPDASWVQVGSKIWDLVLNAFGTASELLKKLVLGEDYTPDSSWADVGNKIWGAINGAFGTASELLKKLVLGEDYTPDATWGQVGTKIWNDITSAFGSAADLVKKLVLGEDYTPDASWGQVGSKIWSTITGAFGSASELVKKLVLGEDYTPDATWADAGSKIWDAVKGAFGTASELLKKLVLGEDYTPDESWSSVGSKIWGKINEGLESASAEGGVVGTLASTLEAALTIAESIASYISSAIETLQSNGTIGEIWNSVKSIAQSIWEIVEQIVSAFTGATKDAAEGMSDAPNGIVSAVELISAAVQAMADGLQWLSDAVKALNEADALVPILEGIGGAIATYFTASAIMNVVSFFKAFSAGSAIFAALNPHILAIAAAVGALIALINWAHDRVKLEDKTVGDYMDVDVLDPIETEVYFSCDPNDGTAIGEMLSQRINEAVSRGEITEEAGKNLMDIYSQYLTPEGMDWEAYYSEGRQAAMELLNGMRDGTDAGAEIPNPADDLLASINETVSQATGQAIDFSNIYSGVDVAAEQAANDALATLNGISDEMNAAGFDAAGNEAAQGYAQGLQNGDVTGAASSVVTTAEDAVRAAQQSGSPAAAFMPIGAEAAQGYGMGILQQDVSGYISSFIAGVGASFRALLSSINLTSAGANVMRGLINGMNSMKGTLMASARTIASQLKSTLQQGLEVHSPSRFTDWVGKMMGQGLVNGLEGMAGKATAAAAAMALGVTSAFAPVAVAAPSITTPEVSATPLQASVSPYEALGGEQGEGASGERRIVVDINGGGRIDITGLTKEQAMELIAERVKPELMNVLAKEIFEGGDGTYEF